MTLLVSGLALFFATHVFTSMRGLRQSAIDALGAMGYRGLYSVVALAGFILIIYGWSQRPFIPIWYPPIWSQHLALTLMLPAMILLVAAYTPAGRIKPALKHPMLVAIK
ncbi:MAG: NnrU family protein, partial [Pseudomonadota bacterium]